MGKFVPIALVSFITIITAFLAQGSEQVEQEEESAEEESEESGSEQESDLDQEGFESIKGSI